MRYHDLFESADTVYAHVSPGQNLSAILQQGLVYNYNNGNYMGYWESLPGVYVTRLPEILRQHIFVRSMDDHYLIVIVHVGGKTFIDEDLIDNLLRRAFDDVTAHGIDLEAIDPEEDVEAWNTAVQEVMTIFLRSMGPPNQAVLSKEPGFVQEYVNDWIIEHLGGETDADWWQDAKALMIKAFPQVQHESRDGSLRIPGKVGYQGKNRITAVVEVTDGEPRLVKGKLSPAAWAFVDRIIR